MSMSFDDLLGTNTKTKTTAKKTKSTAEIIPVPKNVQEQIDSLIAAKKAKKVAESDIKKAEPTIIEHGQNLKNEKAFGGKFQKSFKLGTDESHVNFVTANKWSFLEGDVEDIKEIIGEKADEMILEDKVVKLKAEVFSNPDLQKKFVKMVGKAFPEFFETVVSHHVSDTFDEDIYDLPKNDFNNLMLLMKQSKPSLR
jgi:hypothetical protein